MRKVAATTVVAVALLIGILGSVNAETDPTDASTLNLLYTSLNSPEKLTNWKSSGGDPCLESWRGITCSGPRVTEINLSGLGLTGNMGYQLNTLTAVTNFDISDNKLGNQIPLQLPPNVQRLNLASNGFVASLPTSISQLTSLRYLNVSHNVIEGQVNILFNSSLSTLDFSFNNMTGDLPQSFQTLTSITDMYLQNNQFTGTIDVLGNLPLQNLNIGNNQFTGSIPERLRNINLQSNGNSFDSGPTPPLPPGSPPSDKPGPPDTGHIGRKKSGLSAGLLAGIIAGVLIVLAILAIFSIIKRRKRKSSKQIEKFDNTHFASTKVKETKSVENTSTVSTEAVLNLNPQVDCHKPFEENDVTPQPIVVTKKTKKAPINAKSYSVAELQIATDSFCVENFIGEGSIGRVYRARMEGGEVFAVKKINSSSLSSSEEFLGTVSKISMLYHPNVTELVGYCCEHEQYLLVYKFHNNGSLHEFLHLSDEPLTWNARVKVALGAAKALEYLHEVCSPSVAHENFKSVNVLLDNELNPHLTDCGLARLVHEPDQTSGYVAPEIAMSGQYTIKSDVYSFGVVMLELLTGRTPIDSSRPRSEQSLVRWATPQLHDIDAITKMVDPALDGLYPIKSISRFADVIALCVQPEPEFRPPMSEVVQALVKLVRLAQSKRTFGRNSDAEE